MTKTKKDNLFITFLQGFVIGFGIIFPISSSLWWGLSAVPYTSAVSKNVQPKSMAFSISSVASFSVEGVP